MEVDVFTALRWLPTLIFLVQNISMSYNEGDYRLPSNNSQGRLFLFSHQKGAIIQGKVIIRGRRLFQIFLTGGRVLNILLYYTKQ